MSEFITVAYVTGVFGLKGGVKLALETDIPQRFTPGNKIVARLGTVQRELLVKRLMYSAKTPVLFFENIETPDAAALLIKSSLCISEEQAHEYDDQLDENDFHFSDLIGSQVFVNGLPFGEVKDIVEGGGGHLLEIIKDGRELLVPFVSEIVSTDRLTQGRIDVNPPEGLFDEI